MTHEFLLIDQQEAIATITLNRPERVNALTFPMLRALESELDAITSNTRIKVVIIKGAGRSFSSGVDLRQVSDIHREDQDTSVALYEEHARHLSGPIRRCTEALWRSPVVSIAQIHGDCIMGAWMIAAMCDLVVAAEDARIMWRPVGGAGLAAHLWPWTIGLRKTKELLLTGAYVSGKQAAEMNMITRSAPKENLDDEVRNLALKVARRPREFLYLDKLATNHAFEQMGMWSAYQYSITAHTVGHFVLPDKELAQAVVERSPHELKEILSTQGTAYKETKE